MKYLLRRGGRFSGSRRKIGGIGIRGVCWGVVENKFEEVGWN